MTEDQFQQAVIDLALLRGWRVAHFRPALTKKGWRTPVQGHKGFLDLVLARNGDVIIAELKSETGKLTPDQRVWLENIGERGVVWRPRDLPEIARRLR